MYLNEGFNAFLSKPVIPEKLEQLILQLLPEEMILYEEIQKNQNMDRRSGENPINSTALQQETVRERVRDTEEAELPMIDGIDWSYGQMHLPTKELLLETVEDFYKAIKVEARSLEQFYQQLIKEYGMTTEKKERLQHFSFHEP